MDDRDPSLSRQSGCVELLFGISEPTPILTISAFTAFPRALKALVSESGRWGKLPRLWRRAHSPGVMYLFSQAMMGTCVDVIAISDGELVGLFMRTPDARN